MTAPLPPTDTAVDLEAAWLSADPAVRVFLPGGVLPWARDVADGVKHAELRLESTTERRVDNARVERMHQLHLRIMWPTANAASSLADDQAYLHGTVRALLARIRGTLGDHTHGGAFASAGDTADGNPRGIDVTYDDPGTVAAERAPQLVATLRYGATEPLIVA